MRLAQRHLDDGTVDVDGLLDQGVAELATAIAELRQIAHGLRPTSLDDGLHAALAAITQTLPIPVRLHDRAGTSCRSELATTAYFVAAEAVTNAAKYAQATSIAVRVAQSRRGRADPRRGRRLRWSDAAARLGLSGLVDRVAAVGGSLSMHSPAGARHHDRGGAAVRIVIGEDSALFREGLARLLVDAGHEVVGRAGDADTRW